MTSNPLDTACTGNLGPRHDNLIEPYRQPPASAKYSHNDYNVGWICALPIEMAAAQAMLDKLHPGMPKDPKDTNTYALGSIGRHNVAIACLPAGGYGTNNAATVANNMLRSYPSVNIRLMVGIGGGVPCHGKKDIRLGDIVVGNPIIQYDLGKAVRGGFQRTATSWRPPQNLMTAVSKFQADELSQPGLIVSILHEAFRRLPEGMKYDSPGPSQDWLFESTYEHQGSIYDCKSCDRSRLVERSLRLDGNPKVHVGAIASGNQVMRDSMARDQLASELDIICFEMEAAGLMNESHLVIRGICDYSDSHKNKHWQEYAAISAAAYAKGLLLVIEPNVDYHYSLPLPTLGILCIF
jgi:nucleoside phosphorylase